jgi:hypothetical protein
MTQPVRKRIWISGSSGRMTGALTLAAISAYLVFVGIGSRREPVYLGRGFSSWFDELGVSTQSRAASAQQPALRAIRAMGPAAVPELVKIIRAPEPIMGRIGRRFSRFPGWFGKDSALREYQCHEKAIWCLGEVGIVTTPALAALTNAYVWNSKTIMFEAWAKIDRTNAVPVKALVALMTSPAQTDRFYAAFALRHFGPHPGVLEALIGGLHDSDREVRANCAFSLGEIGPSAAAAIPDLQRVATATTYYRLQVEAARALWKVDPTQAEFAAQAAARVLKKNDPWGAMKLLQEMGPAASSAIPVLEAFKPTAPGTLKRRDELLAQLRGFTARL